MSEPSESFSDADATVLTSGDAIQTGNFPSGLTPRELASALQGESLNHFQLQEFVGGGGMGVVFKALDTTLNRIVAVKVLASHSISDDDLQRRFLIEAHSTARLDHPNIARIHFVGHDRGLSYIVFEYIDGANIRDLVNHNGPTSVADALSFTFQIAHALAHAWQRDVVHRDIKPSNILVTREGHAKLVDMGLARLYQNDRANDDLTNSGVTLGTFDYISPEQARDARHADTRSDIYSLGCTLFYMLAGHAPFAQGTPVQKILQHQDNRPPSLQSLRPEVPEMVDAQVQRMLTKQPANRPQNPVELVAELATIMEALELPLPIASTPLPATHAEPKFVTWRNHVPWAAPIVVILLIAIWVNRQPSADGPVQFPEIRTPSSSATGTPTLGQSEEIAPSAQTQSQEHVASSSPKNLFGESAKATTPVDLNSLLHNDEVAPYPTIPDEDPFELE